ALETQLRLLLALAPIAEISVWTKGADARPICLAEEGQTTQTRRVRGVAMRALEGVPAQSGSRGTILGVPVSRWETPWAALVARTPLGRRTTVTSRISDLDARIWELDRVLRELAHSLEPGSLVRRPLPVVINDEVAAFTERTGIHVQQRVNGDFSGMTVSQKIALIRVVQE